MHRQRRPTVHIEALRGRGGRTLGIFRHRIRHADRLALGQRRQLRPFGLRVLLRLRLLAAAKPDNVSYLVLRLADDSFVHVSFHDHREDEPNPIASTAAFAHFQDEHAERRDGGVDQQTAELVGAYITTIA